MNWDSGRNFEEYISGNGRQIAQYINVTRIRRMVIRSIRISLVRVLNCVE